MPRSDSAQYATFIVYPMKLTYITVFNLCTIQDVIIFMVALLVNHPLHNVSYIYRPPLMLDNEKYLLCVRIYYFRSTLSFYKVIVFMTPD